MAAAIGVVRVERALRRELAWAAYTDPLTGLGNRRAFERDLEQLTARINGRTVVLMLLDLDEFKAINDNYGHVHADHLLVRLGGCCGPGPGPVTGPTAWAGMSSR
jgi:GGDEF domain-containing protein